MKTLQLILFLIFSNICFAQINIEYLSDVPEEFKERYYNQKRDYNPLQIGNTWQYYFEDNDAYWTTKVVKDSIINGRHYFKKINYETDPPSRNFISWERNDTTSGVSFMLDFEDVNENGDLLEELPLDSLENPYWSRYITYKYSFSDHFLWSGEKTVLVKDTSWVKIEGDTVISRYFEILELFWGERIADRFGILFNWSESPIRFCTGAVINGRQYGTIVDVEDIEQTKPTEFILENNFPNPFNPATTISYSLPYVSDVNLTIYNIMGQTVKSYSLTSQNSGYHNFTWEGRDNYGAKVASGIYIYRFTAKSLEGNQEVFSKSAKMILMK